MVIPWKKVRKVRLIEVGPIRVHHFPKLPLILGASTGHLSSSDCLSTSSEKRNRPKTRRWKEGFSNSSSSCIMVSSHLSPLTRSITSWPHWFVPVSALHGYQYRHLLHHWPRYLNVKAEWFTNTDTVYVHASTVSCNWHTPKKQFNPNIEVKLSWFMASCCSSFLTFNLCSSGFCM